MNRIKVIFIVQFLILCLGGCAGDVVEAPQNKEDPIPIKYSVSGSILNEEGEGVAGVSLDFESFGTATSGLDGAWSKSGLEGFVIVTPSKEGWGFDPGSFEVEEETTDLRITGAPLNTLLEIQIEWDEVGDSDLNSARAFAKENIVSTHFGTRLEYPDQNAFFAQALSREEANEFGLITMEVPAAERTDLFVSAVLLNEEGDGQQGQRDPIVWFGELRNIEIVEGTSNTVRMVDIEWTKPMWDFENEEARTAYESGEMVGDKDKTALEFYIIVRDSFGDRSWDEFIGLNGIGGAVIPDSEEGKWRVRVNCRNDLVGQEHESRCVFWPYLKSDKFNLPDIRFSVPPVTIDFIVKWQ